MKLQLKAVLLGLTGIAIVLVMLGGLALSLDERIDAAHQRMDVRTQRLASAGVPLLLNSLVVGDLASAEQTLDSLNVDGSWRDVRLYESDGRTLILDTSPQHPRVSSVPAWVRRLMPIRVKETRIRIAADPVVYAVLAVTPSSAPLEAELWAEIRSAVTMTALLLDHALGHDLRHPEPRPPARPRPGRERRPVRARRLLRAHAADQVRRDRADGRRLQPHGD